MNKSLIWDSLCRANNFFENSVRVPLLLYKKAYFWQSKNFEKYEFHFEFHYWPMESITFIILIVYNTYILIVYWEISLESCSVVLKK